MMIVMVVATSCLLETNTGVHGMSMCESGCLILANNLPDWIENGLRILKEEVDESFHLSQLPTKHCNETYILYILCIQGSDWTINIRASFRFSCR